MPALSAEASQHCNGVKLSLWLTPSHHDPLTYISAACNEAKRYDIRLSRRGPPETTRRQTLCCSCRKAC